MKTFLQLNTIFLSMIMEAIPFILLGVIISGLIQAFVTERWIARVMPGNRFLATMLGCGVGVFFPACECGIVPITKRLLRKGVPLPAGIAFMLTGPIINPIVLYATFIAFGNSWQMALIRAGAAIAVAFVVAVALSYLFPQVPFKDGAFATDAAAAGEGHGLGSSASRRPVALRLIAAAGGARLAAPNALGAADTPAASGYAAHAAAAKPTSGLPQANAGLLAAGDAPLPPMSGAPLYRKLYDVMLHAIDEFFSVGKFLVIGALIAASMQTFIPTSTLLHLGSNPVAASLVMIVLAFVMSLCSEADAFIASSFRSTFSIGAVSAFLVFGPMIDIKNTLMLLDVFRGRFVAALIALTVVCTLAASLAVGRLFG